MHKEELKRLKKITAVLLSAAICICSPGKVSLINAVPLSGSNAISSDGLSKISGESAVYEIEEAAGDSTDPVSPSIDFIYSSEKDIYYSGDLDDSRDHGLVFFDNGTFSWKCENMEGFELADEIVDDSYDDETGKDNVLNIAREDTKYVYADIDGEKTLVGEISVNYVSKNSISSNREKAGITTEPASPEGWKKALDGVSENGWRAAYGDAAGYTLKPGSYYAKTFFTPYYREIISDNVVVKESYFAAASSNIIEFDIKKAALEISLDTDEYAIKGGSLLLSENIAVKNTATGVDITARFVSSFLDADSGILLVDGKEEGNAYTFEKAGDHTVKISGDSIEGDPAKEYGSCYTALVSEGAVYGGAVSITVVDDSNADMTAVIDDDTVIRYGIDGDLLSDAVKLYVSENGESVCINAEYTDTYDTQTDESDYTSMVLAYSLPSAAKESLIDDVSVVSAGQILYLKAYAIDTYVLNDLYAEGRSLSYDCIYKEDIYGANKESILPKILSSNVISAQIEKRLIDLTVSEGNLITQRGGELPTSVSLEDITARRVMEDWEYSDDSYLDVKSLVSGNLLSGNGIRLMTDAIDSNVPGIYGADTDHPAAGLDIANEKVSESADSTGYEAYLNDLNYSINRAEACITVEPSYYVHYILKYGGKDSSTDMSDDTKQLEVCYSGNEIEQRSDDSNDFYYTVYAPLSVSSDGSDFGVSFPEGTYISGWNVFDGDHEEVGSYDYDEEIMVTGSDIYMYAIVSARVSEGIMAESLSPVIYTGRKHVVSDADSKKNTLTNDIELKLTDIRTGKQLQYGSNYTVTYKNNLNASIAYDRSISEGSLYQLQDKLSKRPSIIVRGKGNYKNLSCTLYYDIYPASFEKTAYYNTDPESTEAIDNSQIILDNYDTWMEDENDDIVYYYFLGRNSVKVKDKLLVSMLKAGSESDYRDVTLKKGKDYYEYAQIYDGKCWEDCEITDLDDEGYYRLIACGMGNYTGRIAQDFIISDGFAAEKLTAEYKKKVDYAKNITIKDFDIHLFDPYTGDELTYDEDYYLSRIEKYDPDERDYYTYSETETVFSDAGKYRIYLQPIEEYIYEENGEGVANNIFGQKVLEVSIRGKELKKNMFALGWKTKDYNGSSDSQSVNALEKAPDPDCYEIEIESEDNSAPGKYHAYVYGVGEYGQGRRIDLTYSRKGMKLSDAVKKGMVTISLNDTEVNINGVIPKEGSITVRSASGEKSYALNEESDYCFAVKKASGNKKAGKAKAVIYDASGTFSGSVKADFTIMPKKITKIKDIEDPESYSYDLLSNRYLRTYDPDILYSKIKDVRQGGSVKVELYQADSESKEKLKKLSAKEYVFEEESKAAGFDNYVSVNGRGKDFTIDNVRPESEYNIYTEKIKSSDIVVTLSGQEFTYTGELIYPKLKSIVVKGESYGISSDGISAALDNTFEVSYKNNAAVGKGSVLVTIVGDKNAGTPCYGEKTVSFTIRPQTNEGLIMSLSDDEVFEDDIDEFLNDAVDEDWTPEYNEEIDTTLPPTDNEIDSEFTADDGMYLMAELPSYYKSQNVTSVKNQGSFGWCWSFASIAAMESSLLATSRSLKSKKDLDLSEQQLTYWRMKGIANEVGKVDFDKTRDMRYISSGMNDTDSKTADLKRQQLLDGINSARSKKGLKKLTLNSINLVNDSSIISKGYAFKGGNAMDAAFIAANLGGIADESAYDDAPYKGINSNEFKSWKNGKMPSKGNYRMRQWISVPMSGKHDTVKNLIKTYGGVAAYYFSNINGYKTDYSGSFYLPADTYDRIRGNRISNHEIEIVGWDDNYPASKFRHDPGVDGAWIVKNSWGNNSKLLDKNGYIYISYADPSVERCNVSAWVMTNSTRPDFYQNIYSRTYDTMTYLKDPRQQYCIKYTAKNSEMIKAVGTYLNSNGIVRIKIYKDDANSKIPTNGTVVYNSLHMSSYAGYATFDLKKQGFMNGGPNIEADESYYVVISGYKGAKLKVPTVQSRDIRLCSVFESSRSAMSVYWLGEYRKKAAGEQYTSLIRSADDKNWEYCSNNGKTNDVGITVYTNDSDYTGAKIISLPQKTANTVPAANIKVIKKSYNCIVGQTVDVRSKLNLTRPVVSTKSSDMKVAFYSDKKRIFVKGKGTATVDLFSTVNGQKVKIASVTIYCKHDPKVINVNAKKGAEFSIYKYINKDGLSDVAFSNISKTVRVRLQNGKIINKYPVHLIKKNGSTYIKASYKGTGYIQCRFTGGVSRTMKIVVK